MGGEDFDAGFGIAVDGAGYTYVTGRTISTNFPTTTGAYDTSHNGDMDAFVVKIDQSGASLVYGTYLGGMMAEIGWDIALDGEGRAYVTGETYSTDFPTTPGTPGTSLKGAEDAFVSKLALPGGAVNFAAPAPWRAAFGTSAGGWTSQDRFPRARADVNDDGKAEIVGFGEAGVFVSRAQ